MTHRSPLVTLVGLVAAFAIMFGVNLASSAPRNSYSATPSPSPAASTQAPSDPDRRRASPTEAATPSPSVTASAEDTSEFPEQDRLRRPHR